MLCFIFLIIIFDKIFKYITNHIYKQIKLYILHVSHKCCLAFLKIFSVGVYLCHVACLSLCFLGFNCSLFTCLFYLQHNEREFLLKFSAMEIYNESVRDLLSTDSTPLRLLDDPEVNYFLGRLNN